MKDAHARYLRCVDRFLQCADHALRSYLPADDLETVRAYTGDVLTHLTRVLLKVFAADGTQLVRTTVDGEGLWDVMHRLARNVSDGVLQCISDDLRPDILRMTDALSEPYDYDDNSWGWGIQHFSRVLKDRVIRNKGEPDTEYVLIYASV